MKRDSLRTSRAASRFCLYASVLAIVAVAVFPMGALAAPAWVSSPDGSFHLKVNSPLDSIVLGQGEEIRLRFEVKGSNPNEKFALFMTPSTVTDYSKVTAENIVQEYAGIRIQYDLNQLPDTSNLYVDFMVNLTPGQYNLWVQYYNGSNVAQSAHLYIPVTVAEKATWNESGGQWYLERGGVRLTGLQYSHGNYYFLTSSGAMTRGWQNVSGQWRYFNSAGIMQVGWIKEGSRWYFSDASGLMRTGWLQVNGVWFLLGNSGAMLTGWQKIGSQWYYLSGSGAMLTGWQKIGSQWYYLGGSGAMLTGTHNIGGTTYTFNASGVWVS